MIREPSDGEISTSSFDDLILETVDDVFKRVFGAKLAKPILNHMKKRLESVKDEKNSKMIEVISETLKEILGSGSAIVEAMILKNLYSKLKLNYEEKELRKKLLTTGFSGCIMELRKAFSGE